jgi:hypothetical protein
MLVTNSPAEVARFARKAGKQPVNAVLRHGNPAKTGNLGR